MKSIIFFWTLFLLGIVLTGSACRASKNQAAADSSYACPMHPEVTGRKGDLCSKCHMPLEVSHAPAVFCCPIHKECTSKISGKCPKCGTPMEQPVEPYSCPMHPDQKGVKGGRCPKCHMEMEKAKQGKGMGR